MNTVWPGQAAQTALGQKGEPPPLPRRVNPPIIPGRAELCPPIIPSREDLCPPPVPLRSERVVSPQPSLLRDSSSAKSVSSSDMSCSPQPKIKLLGAKLKKGKLEVPLSLREVPLRYTLPQCLQEVPESLRELGVRYFTPR